MLKGKKPFIILLLLVVGAAVYLTMGAQGPSYEGRPLRDWLVDYGRNTGQRGGSFAAKCEEALAHIGSNAVPDLLQILGEGPPEPNGWFSMIRDDLLSQLSSTWTGRRERQYTLFETAPMAFRWGGEPAIKAIPQLEHLALTSPSSFVQVQALTALRYVGKASLPTLLRIAANTTNAEAVRVASIDEIAQIQMEEWPPMPELLRCVDDTKSTIRFATVNTLARAKSAYKPNPESVAALIKALQDPEPTVRYAAARALQDHGKEGAQALRAARLSSDPKLSAGAERGYRVFGIYAEPEWTDPKGPQFSVP